MDTNVKKVAPLLMIGIALIVHNVPQESVNSMKKQIQNSTGAEVRVVEVDGNLPDGFFDVIYEENGPLEGSPMPTKNLEAYKLGR